MSVPHRPEQQESAVVRDKIVTNQQRWENEIENRKDLEMIMIDNENESEIPNNTNNESGIPNNTNENESDIPAFISLNTYGSIPSFD